MKRMVSLALTFAILCAVFCVFSVPAKAYDEIDQFFNLGEQYQEIVFEVTGDNLHQRIELWISYQFGYYIFQTFGSEEGPYRMALYDIYGNQLALASNENGFGETNQLIQYELTDSGIYYLELDFVSPQFVRLSATYAQSWFVSQPDLYDFYDIETYSPNSHVFFFDEENMYYAQVILIKNNTNQLKQYTMTVSEDAYGKVWLVRPWSIGYLDAIMIDGTGSAEVIIGPGVTYYLVVHLDFGGGVPPATLVDMLATVVTFVEI